MLNASVYPQYVTNYCKTWADKTEYNLIEVLEDPSFDAFLDDVVLHDVDVRGDVLLNVVVVPVLHLQLVLYTYNVPRMSSLLLLISTAMSELMNLRLWCDRPSIICLSLKHLQFRVATFRDLLRNSSMVSFMVSFTKTICYLFVVDLFLKLSLRNNCSTRLKQN